MSASPDSRVRKRAVFFIGGYDPKSADTFFLRTDRENGRFEEVWDTKVDPVEREQLSADITRVHYQAGGGTGADNWQTETDFHFLTLDDVVLTDFDKPLPIRFGRYLITFLDYVLTGTAFKFIRHAWRFSLYFFYPAFMIAMAVLLAVITATAVGSWATSSAWFTGPVLFAITFAVCVWWGGKRYHVLHLMDLWSFSRDFLYNNQSRMRDKLDGLASHIAAAHHSGKYDEILLIGHSTGGALILDAAGRAGEKSPDFGKSENVTVLTVGSTALKIGLHPAAGWFRNRLLNLFTNAPVSWVEYQCLSDVINFNRTNPASLMGFAEKMQRPLKTGRIKVQDMIEPETYKRIRKNFFRIHYQFVFGNNQRYFYDFPAICFGPAPIQARINSPFSFMKTLTGEDAQAEKAI